MSNENDIKAPDGFLLGGLRRVHKDGAILFQRGYWQAPIEWAGERVWVHEGFASTTDDSIALQAWPPGVRIWTQGADTVLCGPVPGRSDAKPGYRNPSNVARHNRVR